MKLLSLTLLAACTIDPVARAELAGDPSGDAIFQRSGTRSQVSYEVTMSGADGTFDVSLDDGSCGGALTPWHAAGTITVAGGTGLLRAVKQDWNVASGDNDVVGRALVVRDAAAAVASCGVIFNSD